MHKDRFPEGFLSPRNRISHHAGEGLAARALPEVGIGELLPYPPEALTPALPAATVRGRVAGRVRSVTRSPAQEFACRSGKLRKISRALEIALMGATVKATVKRNGISFVPKLMNPEGSVKRLTWWYADSPVCKPGWFGREVLVAYDPFDCSIIHVLDANGAYLDTLPMKGKTPWFDADATQKAIAETRRIVGRLQNQLQALHVEDSEAAATAAESNKATIERIVQTFPLNGRKKAPARSSGNETSMGVAHTEAKLQRAKHETHEAEIQRRIDAQGHEAVTMLLDSKCSAEPPDAHELDDAADFIL
jgi:hypothetical protein